jgi:hypothetical protein
MSETLPAKAQRAVPIGKDDLPKRGEWYWVRDSEEDQKPALMCVEHIGSNFVRFTAAHSGGGYIWATWTEECRDRYERRGSDRVVKGIYKVTSIKKDRTAVRVSWSRGKREGWEFPTGWWSGHGRWGIWDYKNKWCHKWIPMKDCFNVDAYVPGEYKTFLCDAYLKGAYLQWAPQLLSAEKHWRESE